MGLSRPGNSECSCERKVIEVVVAHEKAKPQKKETKAPNPDPKNFVIKRVYSNEFAIALLIHYVGCTNYEGNKILVFQTQKLDSLLSSTKIDPHFCPEHHDRLLMARFIPTDFGWKQACKLVDELE